MRDEVSNDVSDAVLLAALIDTHVAVIADARNINSHAAQTAFVTVAMLMARSGHCVYVIAPDLPLVGAQPPLTGTTLTAALMAAGTDLLPGGEFATACDREVDLAVAFGDSPIPLPARRCIRLNASAWAGELWPVDYGRPWDAQWSPLGGMAAAGLAAAEAFKIAMKKLSRGLRNPARMATVFAETREARVALALEGTPLANDLGRFDCISGEAIIHAALYALARVPGVGGHARVIEPDCGALTNLNRYMLLTRSGLQVPKGDDLARVLAPAGLRITPMPIRYEQETVGAVGPLAARVLVGVDDIPSRWLVQRQDPCWMAVGATTHWSAMASVHEPGGGCAECLHPYDEPGNAPIPTVAFVSYWAGLLTAAYFLRQLAGDRIGADDRQIFLTPFRAENALWAAVPVRPGCPSCAAAERRPRLAG